MTDHISVIQRELKEKFKTALNSKTTIDGDLIEKADKSFRKLVDYFHAYNRCFEKYFQREEDKVSKLEECRAHALKYSMEYTSVYLTPVLMYTSSETLVLHNKMAKRKNKTLVQGLFVSMFGLVFTIGMGKGLLFGFLAAFVIIAGFLLYNEVTKQVDPEVKDPLEESYLVRMDLIHQGFKAMEAHSQLSEKYLKMLLFPENSLKYGWEKHQDLKKQKKEK